MLRNLNFKHQWNRWLQVKSGIAGPKAVPPVLEAIRTELFDGLTSRKDKIQGYDIQSEESKTEDVIQLKPNIYGIGVDLKALWKKLKK